MNDLSAKQKMILEYIKSEVKYKGYPPSVREICEAVNLRSTSTVHAHLDRLEKKGYIRRDPSKPRAIEIILEDEESVDESVINVPIVGTITAGMPILAVENIDGNFPIPASYVNRNDTVFMLKIRGESMINAGIYDKDLVLVRQQNTAENGDIIVAGIEDFATVKRYFKEKGHIRLQPENPSMSPILVKDVAILGKVIGLFRKM